MGVLGQQLDQHELGELDELEFAGIDWSKDVDKLDIVQVFGKAKIEDIQRKISKATGIAFITVDYKGEPVTEATNFTRFCQRRRENPKGVESCSSSDAFGSIQAAVTKRPCVYFCPCGLLEVAIPIVIDGHYLGGFVGGQVRCTNAPEEVIHLEQVIRRKEKDGDGKVEETLLEEIPTYRFESFMDVANLVFMIINLLTETEINRRQEKEQLKRQISKITMSKQKYKKENAANTERLEELRTKINPYELLDLLTLATNSSIVEGAETTNRILMGLTRYLKYLFFENDEEMEVGRELANVREYLEMCREKYGDTFSYEIISEDMEKVEKEQILSGLILPFVQSAVYFGCAQNAEEGRVMIRTGYEKSQVFIEISDNGPAYTEAQIDRKFARFQENYEGYNIRIAMENAKRKLRNHYNGDAGVEIRTDKNQGTTCTIFYPAG